MVDATVKYDTTQFYPNPRASHPAYDLNKVTLTPQEINDDNILDINNDNWSIEKCLQLFDQCVQHYVKNIKQDNKTLYDGILA
jgi:hypothetical protein